MAWTDEMVEDLKRMWKEGLTTGEIGKRMNVSKNTIVGKVQRLGLSGRPSPIKKKDGDGKQPVKNTPAPETKKKPEAPKAQPQIPVSAPLHKSAPEKHTVFEPKFMPKAVSKEHSSDKTKHNLSLTELDNHTCRWPLGDPKDDNFRFCGKKVRIGQTYCDEHAAIAYVKPGKK